MQILLVTEKFDPRETQRDGGSRLVNSLRQAFGDALKILQFDCEADSDNDWRFTYPHFSNNRFQRRLANAKFVGEKVKAIGHQFTHIIFSHTSMQFCLKYFPLPAGIKIITFPMFLTPSYEISGEVVPKEYYDNELSVLKRSDLILTPSYFEKSQLINRYHISEEKIRVIPRGIDTSSIAATVKQFNGSLKFCSIGSIKRQKNTLELIHLFANIYAKYNTASLSIIGPVQDHEYQEKVRKLINNYNLEHAIELKGYVAPKNMASFIHDCHIHLSTASCETFGRSIFETLAAGLPNIVRKNNNAAADFLLGLPYIHFVDSNTQALAAIEEILPNLTLLSSLASEVASLYDDRLLSRLLVAEICDLTILAVSDFDGTLYHKNDPAQTQYYMDQFKKYPIRVISSARGVNDLLSKLKLYDLEVDWIIAYSGAVVTDGRGEVCWTTPLEDYQLTHLKKLHVEFETIKFDNKILQICSSQDTLPVTLGLRNEIYQNNNFIAHWKASKLHALYQLLRHLNHSGRVRVFGDGKYDLEMITYFNGTLVKNEGIKNDRVIL